MAWVLGVDLGTTSCAAGAVSDDRVETLHLGASASAVPSAVYASDGSFAVGEQAMALGAAHPERLALEFKRQIGGATPLSVGDRFLSAEELQAVLGSWVYRRACELQGGPPERAMFTFPAFWGGYRRDRFSAVVHEIVGPTTPVDLVTEPEAAAVYYATRDRLPTGAVVAVYDLGGGTFDASVLRKTDQGFELLGRPAGDDELGGSDLDRALLAHVVAAAGLEWNGLDRTDAQVGRGLQQLRRDVTLAKELLSTELTADVPVALPGTVTTVRVTRREFEELATPLVARTVAVVEQALSYANTPAASLRSILLVGGASRMPLVAERLAQRFPAPLALDSHPKFAVSLGAAIAGSRPEQLDRLTGALARRSAAADLAAVAGGGAIAGGIGVVGRAAGAGRPEPSPPTPVTPADPEERPMATTPPPGQPPGLAPPIPGRPGALYAAAGGAGGPGAPAGPNGGGGASGPSRRVIAVVAAVAAVIVIAVVAVVLSRGGDGPSTLAKDVTTTAGSRSTASTGTTASRATTGTTGTTKATPATSPPTTAPKNVTVPGTVAFTDTGIDVAPGDTITIDATGSITVAPTPDYTVGPDGGTNHPEWSQFNLQVGGAPLPAGHGALVAKIANGNPRPVGHHAQFVADASGRLFLGINDVGVDNNTGQFQAQVSITKKA